MSRRRLTGRAEARRPGCEGTLLSTDNRLVDAALAPPVALGNTEQLCPLVPVQPVCISAYLVEH
jgi:hypothetical protein